jgi:hypothetical protein
VPDRERILDVGEDALVAAVITRYGAMPAHVLVGPGDDTAVLEVPGRVVLSTDTLADDPAAGHQARPAAGRSAPSPPPAR